MPRRRMNELEDTYWIVDQVVGHRSSGISATLSQGVLVKPNPDPKKVEDEPNVDAELGDPGTEFIDTGPTVELDVFSRDSGFVPGHVYRMRLDQVPVEEQR